MFASDSDSPQPWPLNWPCHLSPSTLRLLSCIVMFYSTPGEYWKIIHCRQAETRANNPSWPFTDEPPLRPSNRAHLDLSMTMTEGHRFDIHYSTVGAGGLKYTWCTMGIRWVNLWKFFALKWLENPVTSLSKEHFGDFFLKREFYLFTEWCLYFIEPWWFPQLELTANKTYTSDS